MKNQVVLIHGYSDVPESFDTWRKLLHQHGFEVEQVHSCGYCTLTNEVSIKDIAEGFDRALRLQTGLAQDETFDAIVHSTGMLVIRAWLTTYAKRKNRLKRLIALAPASFGSPLAHKGRSWLGAVFKGNKKLGPDFMEAGDLVLDGLELGSQYTWKLAHQDLLCDEVFYGPDDTTPYVFTFCGNQAYSGLRGIVTNPKGSDGTVRWAGCSLNTRKIDLNLTLLSMPEKAEETVVKRLSITDWANEQRCNLAVPFIPIEGVNHTSILEEPTDELVKLVIDALSVSNKEDFFRWNVEAVNKTAGTVEKMEKWQQFIIHAQDERGDPINDYNFSFWAFYDDQEPELIEVEVHSYSRDKSYRSFHINLDNLKLEQLKKIQIEIIASSGTELVKYYGHQGIELEEENKKACTAVLEVDQEFLEGEFKLFYPFTTTLVELRLNREPEPPKSFNKVAWFHVEKES